MACHSCEGQSLWWGGGACTIDGAGSRKFVECLAAGSAAGVTCSSGHRCCLLKYRRGYCKLTFPAACILQQMEWLCPALIIMHARDMAATEQWPLWCSIRHSMSRGHVDQREITVGLGCNM